MKENSLFLVIQGYDFYMSLKYDLIMVIGTYPTTVNILYYKLS